ncbi:Uncharacterised protein [Mycobacteroides abscessus subsp. abscessus]|nr:Uncharacterised protein [Mycobacteroides abscessus subsp. abscessus]
MRETRFAASAFNTGCNASSGETRVVFMIGMNDAATVTTTPMTKAMASHNHGKEMPNCSDPVHQEPAAAIR